MMGYILLGAIFLFFLFFMEVANAFGYMGGYLDGSREAQGLPLIRGGGEPLLVQLYRAIRVRLKRAIEGAE